MDLRTYTKQLPHGGMTELARKCGISAIYLSQLAAKQDGRVPSAVLAGAIEVATRGAVKRWDLRPDDWHLIWPELKKAKGAPAIPAEAAQG